MGQANAGLRVAMTAIRHLRLLSVLLLASCAQASPLDPGVKAVEQIRGRSFTSEVRNVTIDRSELSGHLRSQMERSTPYSFEEWSTILRALQLVDGRSQDLLPELLALYESQVLAFYDPQTHTYYSIRQLPDLPEEAKLADPKILEETVMVHELMHALQDQHFNLARREKALRLDTDANMAYHAFLEGEAVLVMMAHMLRKSGVDLGEVVNDDSLLSLMGTAVSTDSMIDPKTPRYFAEMLKFPYLNGLQFAIEAYRRGGWKQFDLIHDDPPRTTREILHPDEYFSDRRAKPAFDSKAPKGAIAAEHLGEFHWRFLVGADNATGWVNDRAVIHRDGRVEVETSWESEDRAAAFASAYREFLDGRGLVPRVERKGTAVTAAYTTR